MTAIRIASVLAMAMLAAGADDTEGVRSLLRDFNHAVRKPEPQSFRKLFTPSATYRDHTRIVTGVESLVSLFTDNQIWSERTPPKLQEESITLIGQSVALVDVQLVQYGSTIVKSSVPMVLLVEKDAGTWRISALRTCCWRMHGGCVPWGN